MGVSPRTVQRWLSGTNGRQVAKIPAKRLAQLIELTLPDADVLRRERADFLHADGAVARVKWRKGTAVPKQWKAKGWMVPHQVAIVEFTYQGQKFRQIRYSKSARRAREWGGDGVVVSSTTMPDVFHARVLAFWVLQQMRPWRYQPDPRHVTKAPSRSWFGDAPKLDLAQVGAMVLEQAGAGTLAEQYEQGDK